MIGFAHEPASNGAFTSVENEVKRPVGWLDRLQVPVSVQAVDRDGAIALLRHAVEAGVTLIDTADVYGPHTNELLIREALHPYPEHLVIATKGGFVRGGLGRPRKKAGS